MATKDQTTVISPASLTAAFKANYTDRVISAHRGEKQVWDTALADYAKLRVTMLVDVDTLMTAPPHSTRVQIVRPDGTLFDAPNAKTIFDIRELIRLFG